jgi:hypothetical protein
MHLRLSILAIFLGASGFAFAAPGEDFARANRFFENGDFDGAKSAYETLVGADHLSPELFYNLGAAHHRAGQSGAGVLWMRRALVLDPGMAEARQSLAFLRSHLGCLEFSESGPARFIAALPPGFAAWSISLCVWIACLSAAAGFFLPRLRPSLPAFLALAAVLLVTAVAAHLVSRYRATTLAVENFATVLSAETDALTSPTPDAKKVIDLPPGSEVRLLQRSDKWSYVEIPGDLRGWVRSDTIAPVWPIERPPAAP